MSSNWKDEESKGARDSHRSRSGTGNRRRERVNSDSDDSDSHSHRRREGERRYSDRDRHLRHGRERDHDSSRRSRSREAVRERAEHRDNDNDFHQREYDQQRERRSLRHDRNQSHDNRSPRPEADIKDKSPRRNDNFSEATGISLKLAPAAPPSIAKPVTAVVASLPKPVPVAPIARSSAVASIFNADDDDEEEMPPEAKMRMKNVGRNTPTSAGPNSFGKTKIGFCNALHIAGRDLEAKELGEK